MNICNMKMCELKVFMLEICELKKLYVLKVCKLKNLLISKVCVLKKCIATSLLRYRVHEKKQ